MLPVFTCYVLFYTLSFILDLWLCCLSLIVMYNVYILFCFRFGVVHSLILNESLFDSKPYEYYIRYTLLPRLLSSSSSSSPSSSSSSSSSSFGLSNDLSNHNERGQLYSSFASYHPSSSSSSSSSSSTSSSSSSSRGASSSSSPRAGSGAGRGAGSHAPFSTHHFGASPKHPITHSTHVIFHYGPRLKCPTENRIIGKQNTIWGKKKYPVLFILL